MPRKNRLTNNHKDLLEKFAIKYLKERLEIGKEFHDLEHEILNSIVDVIKNYIPKADLAVFSKYGFVKDDIRFSFCIKGVPFNNYTSCWQLPLDKNGNQIWLPYVNDLTYKIDKESKFGLMLIKHREYKLKYRHEFDKRLKSFKALIQNCNYYEDILKVWPEVDELKDQIVKNKDT